MAKEGAVDLPSNSIENAGSSKHGSYKYLEGKKFRAPHQHNWGQIAYHNAMICSVPDEISSDNKFEVKLNYSTVIKNFSMICFLGEGIVFESYS